MKKNRLKRTKIKGMEIKENEKVLIKISLRDGGFWEKEYSQSDTIQNVVDDFKEQNFEEIPEEYISEWKKKSQSFNLDDEIKTLFINELQNVILNQDEIKIPISIGIERNIPDLVGKPFNNPFEIMVFRKIDKILKIQKYDNEDIEKENLDDYGSSSAYCNGNNYLFISGGEKNNMEIVDKLWKINLENQKIDRFDMKPKKNHSMIYIPGNYVFIVGGNDLKTFYFNIQNDKIIDWSELNRKRIEPSLILIKNYLYCFDNVNSKNNNEEFTFEKTDITSENGEWEIIKPNFDSLGNQKIEQKFFAVTKDSDENILFLGGNMDNEENDENQTYNYKYNMNNNNIEISDIEFKEYNFKEKTFLSYNGNIDYILPDFNRHHPEIIFFQKKENKLSLVKYESNKSKKDNNMLLRGIKKAQYNFSMPSISVPTTENRFMNKNTNNEEKNIENSDKKNENYKNSFTNSFESKNEDKNIKLNLSDSEENKIKICESSNGEINYNNSEKIPDLNLNQSKIELDKDSKKDDRNLKGGKKLENLGIDNEFENLKINKKIPQNNNHNNNENIENKKSDFDDGLMQHLSSIKTDKTQLDNKNEFNSELNPEYYFYLSGYIEKGKVVYEENCKNKEEKKNIKNNNTKDINIEQKGKKDDDSKNKTNYFMEGIIKGKKN